MFFSKGYFFYMRFSLTLILLLISLQSYAQIGSKRVVFETEYFCVNNFEDAANGDRSYTLQSGVPMPFQISLEGYELSIIGYVDGEFMNMDMLVVQDTYKDGSINLAGYELGDAYIAHFQARGESELYDITLLDGGFIAIERYNAVYLHCNYNNCSFDFIPLLPVIQDKCD